MAIQSHESGYSHSEEVQNLRNEITLEAVFGTAGINPENHQEFATQVEAAIEQYYQLIQNLLNEKKVALNFSDSEVAMKALNGLFTHLKTLSRGVARGEEIIKAVLAKVADQQLRIDTYSLNSAEELSEELISPTKLTINGLLKTVEVKIGLLTRQFPSLKRLAPTHFSGQESYYSDGDEAGPMLPVWLSEAILRMTPEAAIQYLSILLLASLTALGSGDANADNKSRDLAALVVGNPDFTVEDLTDLSSAVADLAVLFESTYGSLENISDQLNQLDVAAIQEAKAPRMAREVESDLPVEEDAYTVLDVKFDEPITKNSHFIDFRVALDNREVHSVAHGNQIISLLRDFSALDRYAISLSNIGLRWDQASRSLFVQIFDANDNGVDVLKINIGAVVRNAVGREQFSSNHVLLMSDFSKDAVNLMDFNGSLFELRDTSDSISDDNEPTEPIAETAEVFVVGPNGANVRAEASSANGVEIKVRVSSGDFLQIIEEVEGTAVGGNTTWYQVVTANGVVGYVSATTGEVQEIAITTEEDTTPEAGEPPTPSTNGNETPPANETETSATDVPAGTPETVTLNGETVELTATPEGVTLGDQVVEGDLATPVWQAAMADVTDITFRFDENHKAYVINQGGIAARLFFNNDDHTEIIAYDGEEVVFNLELNAIPIEFSGPTSITVDGREITVLTGTDITEIDGVEIGWGYNDVEMPLGGEYRQSAPRSSDENGNFWNFAYVKGIYLSTNQSQMQVFIPDGHGGGGIVTMATVGFSGEDVTMMGNGEFIAANGTPSLSRGQIVVFEIIPAEENSHNIATAMASANGVDTYDTIQNPSDEQGDDFVFVQRIIHASFLP